MLISGPLEKARLYVDKHSKHKDFGRTGKCAKGPCITISRETGAGADIVSQKLVEILQKYMCENLPDWTIFDKNLIEKVIEDHNLPRKISDSFDEKKYSAILSFASEVLVNEPSIHTLVHKTTHTILSLAEIGNVVIIGRGGNVITSNLHNAFHVRLVSTIEQRIKHVQKVYGYNMEQAAIFLKKDDKARKNYLYTYFHEKINDPLLYHLILNTNRLGHDHAAEMIANTVMTKFPKYFKHSPE
jgi:cytidylate kinase